MGFEEKSSFELARPVMSGLEKILPLVRRIGHQAISDDVTSGVFIPGLSGPTQDDVLPANIAGRPRFREYKNIRLPLLQYTYDQQVGGKMPDFYGLARAMTRGVESKKLNATLQEIPQKMFHIALEFDSISAETAEANCHGFSISPSTYKKGFELFIDVANPERFMKEKEVYTEVFKDIKLIKPYVNLDTNKGFNIPLAWLDAETTEWDRDLLLGTLNNLAPNTYKVHLGPVLKPFVR